MYPAEAGGGFSCSKFLKFRCRIWVCLEREGTYTHLLFYFLFSSPFVFMNSKIFLLPPKLIMILGDN